MDRILIFEQDPKEAIHLSQFLQNSGYAVATVTTGRQAISFIREYEFEVYLVNLTYPGENGFTTIAELKCRPQGDGVVIIAIVPNLDALDSALCAGCDHALMQPFDNSELLQVISDFLERSHSSITYMHRMNPQDHTNQGHQPGGEATFASITESILIEIAALEKQMDALGDQGPLAIESMTEASASLHRRLDAGNMSPSQNVPVSVLDRQVRHDFRNLLAAVNGFSEILLLEDHLAQDIRERLLRIKHGSRTFCNLLDGIKESAA